MIYRGHFIANGKESTFKVETQGGTAYSASVWLNSGFLGSFVGTKVAVASNNTFTLSAVTSSQSHILTIVIDHMGNDEDWSLTRQNYKTPRGILDYQLAGHQATDIVWRATGNLGGEDYKDRTRGPRNEGGTYAERQGWHQPGPPSQGWKSSSPMTGIAAPGMGFYT